MEVLSAADGLGTTHDQQVYNWAATVSESKRKITEVVGTWVGIVIIVCESQNKMLSPESRPPLPLRLRVKGSGNAGWLTHCISRIGTKR